MNTGSAQKVYGSRHVCWAVRGDDDLASGAQRYLQEARDRGEKTLAFGPDRGWMLEQFAGSVDVAVDPRVAFLPDGPFDAQAMYAIFREQDASARAEGYTGICVVADMDWLLPLGLSSEQVIGFELHLDQVVADLGATVICAYRTSS